MRNDNGNFVFDEVVVSGLKVGFTSLPYAETLRAVQSKLNDDKERRLTKALIELGWTPPKKAIDRA